MDYIMKHLDGMQKGLVEEQLFGMLLCVSLSARDCDTQNIVN